ncbi:MAG TPA: endonuclease III [Candidatus Latescibacteria bacterium]|nr:endonuclease III [Candidatus Latescibacterota bacterium]
MDSAAPRIKPVIRLLRKHCPQARTALEFGDPLEILVATILAAQCTDERVNRITPGLFRKYPTAAAFAVADRTELEQEIRSAGFFRNKAKAIIGAARRIVETYGGAVPDSMAALVTLPGVARKTANIVLSAGYGKAEGIAVDTHAGRISRRLGLSRHEDPVKVERDLLKLVPKGDWLDFNFLLVEHGRALCQARKPKCPDCFLRRLCPSAEAFISGGKPK